MSRIYFRNFLEFVLSQCADCAINCYEKDALTCDHSVYLVQKQIEQGYQVQVGKFIVIPQEHKTTDDLIGLLPKEIGVPPCGSVLQIRFVDGMVRVSYGTSGDPAERHLYVNEDIHKALENMVIHLQKQGEL